MTDKIFYPAVFHKEGDGFWVSFPDFPECFTEGDDMKHAYEMAVDALGLAITSRRKEGALLPKPSDPDLVSLEEGLLMIVHFDMLDYLRKHNSKAVKKTLSIPEWLNEEAMRLGINFSQVLQEALMKIVMTK